MHPPADIRLLFLKHCSPWAQQEAKSAQTRAVGLLLMTQLITLLTTTPAACCPLKGPGTVSPPGPVAGWKPLLSPLSWQKLKPHLLTVCSSVYPGPMRTDLKGPGPGAGRVGHSRRLNQIHHLPDGCAPPSAFSFSVIVEVIPKILCRVQ